jgi:hypothetical protein
MDWVLRQDFMLERLYWSEMTWRWCNIRSGIQGLHVHIDMYSTFGRHRIEETCQFICLGLIVFLGEIVCWRNLYIMSRKLVNNFLLQTHFWRKAWSLDLQSQQSIERSLKTQHEIKSICETMEFQHRNFETLQENVVFLTQKSNTCHYLMSNCHFDVIYATINTKYCTL